MFVDLRDSFLSIQMAFFAPHVMHTQNVKVGDIYKWKHRTGKSNECITMVIISTGWVVLGHVNEQHWYGVNACYMYFDSTS